jgi:hypothetical protein
MSPGGGKIPPEKAKELADEEANKELAEKIRKRAYEIYWDRVSTGKPGDSLDDWLQAKRELEKNV